MTYYTKILPWSNKWRIDRLTEFRNLVVEYFNNSRAEWVASERIEERAAEDARVKINRMMDEAHDLILYSGVNPVIRYTPPAVVGGYIQSIDLIRNIFLLHRFNISPRSLLDNIDQAIGVYECNKRPALLRAINPFYYIGRGLDWVARMPFVLIGRAGFDQQRAEGSFAGRLIKGAVYIVTALASLLTVLQLLDYIEPVKAWAKGLVK
jgi:hypothetical protein